MLWAVKESENVHEWFCLQGKASPLAEATGQGTLEILEYMLEVVPKDLVITATDSVSAPQCPFFAFKRR